MHLYSIGHSNHTWERFSALLLEHGIQTLVDVRSRPVSRWAPFANARTLPQRLDEIGVRHSYMGDALGGKPSDPELLDADGQPDYSKIGATVAFKEGITGLVDLSAESTVALMSAEESPKSCHRRLLLGPALQERGVDLRHIRKDGALDPAEALL